MEPGVKAEKAGERSDQELLQGFAADRSEAAFRELVERYLGMLFAVAFRKLQNRQWAEEAVQNAFTVLARKAGKLPGGTVLGAWLHRVTWLECSEILRRELRRKEIMREYAQSAEAAQEAPGSAKEIVEALDEAMARLAGRDRDLLVLRFHGGLGFGEIAARLGVTEEAGRKRVERALKKLSHLLAKRGITAGMAVLSASLSTAWASAAPAGLAGAVVNGALGATAGSTGAFTFLMFMSQAQLKGALVTGALLAATVSFLIGRQEAKTFQNAARGQSRAAVPAEFWSAPLRSAPGAAGALPANLSGGGRELMERAVRAVREAESGSDAHYAAVLALQPMRSGDVLEAVEFLNGIEEAKVLATLVPIVGGVWARIDPEEASAWVESRLKGSSALASGYRRVLRGWAAHEPKSAYAWYQAKAAGGMDGIAPNSFRWLPIEIFSQWALRNPWEAVLALNDVTLEDRQGAIQGFCDALEQSPDPAPVVSAIQGMPEGRFKQELIRKVSKRWAKGAPEAAAAWLDSVWLSDEKSQFRTRAEIAEEWIQQDQGAFMKAGAWLLAGTPNEMRGEILDALAREGARIAKESSSANP